jgi:replicative DNA helicase
MTDSLDLTVLRLFRDRGRYERLFSSVSERAVDPKSYRVLKSMGRWFREHDDQKLIPMGEFPSYFKSINPKMPNEEMAVYLHIIQEAQKEADPGLEVGLLKRLTASAKAAELAEGLAKYAEGEEVDFRTLVSGVLDDYDRIAGTAVKAEQVLTPIDKILDVEQNDIGFTWPLPCMNQSIKPMRPGDFAILAASVDAGKTTMTAHVATHIAPQVDQLFPGEERSILWLCNEGPGDNIVMRCWQSAGAWTIEDLAKMRAQGGVELMREEYRKALGGRAGVLRIFEIHGRNTAYVEGLMRRYKPAAVIFDMIDNIEFSGKSNHGGERTDQVLEAMYQWARLMGVKYNCSVYATSQLSVDGFGMTYPQQHMLKDSKVGKQGAADVIITLGKSADPGLSKSRFIGAPKNKRVRAGNPQSPMKEVRFDGDRARLVEE